jgi:hypothetical protein
MTCRCDSVMNQYFDTAIKAARAAGALVMGRLKMELEWLKKKVRSFALEPRRELICQSAE